MVTDLECILIVSETGLKESQVDRVQLRSYYKYQNAR